MQEICAEANISAGALYRYYASKAEIIGAIAEEKQGDSDDRFFRAAQTSSVVDALSVIALDFFEKFAEGDGAVIADIFAECIRDDAIAEALHEIHGRIHAHCVEVIKAGQARGEVDRTLEPEQTANILFAAIEGIGLRRAFLRETDPHAALAQFRELAKRYLSPSHE